ncbi:hypothetical protein G6K88_15640 [Agrobacterium rhizogenes]|uniref:hypothetical protein n=1 Tax=Rhizobium rhizogenes TaxID=359 RepID=UPI001572541D|nr:hypothetical protein [Rhizobium rhizogenes]NTI03456.1 hypothetical protein [Rhizobium rhizogenes]NTI10261.1 hypothetical protein [Rhizobium rhizogenes]
MTRSLDILDQIHNLRDLLGLLNLAAQSLEMKHERDALERGTIVAQGILRDIETVVDTGEELA